MTIALPAILTRKPTPMPVIKFDPFTYEPRTGDVFAVPGSTYTVDANGWRTPYLNGKEYAYFVEYLPDGTTRTDYVERGAIVAFILESEVC